MNSSLKHAGGPAGRSEVPAFTLIELQVALVVIAVLIGVLLPAVQRTREANNETAAQRDLRTILAAENTYFQSHMSYSDSFTTLGLGTTFSGNDTADGYIFTIVLTVTNLYTVTAVPVTPGLTASVDYRMDQTGKIFASPDPGAIAQHEQTTTDIQTHAMQVTAQLIQETDTNQTDIPIVTHALMAPGAVSKAFAQVASNGKLTITGILSYTGPGATEMAPLMAAIQSDFQFGTAGEDTGGISLTLRQVLDGDGPIHTIGGILTISWSGADGVSPFSINSFSDGSLRAGTVSFQNPEVFTTVTRNQVVGGGPGFVYSGPLTITDIFGQEPSGFVVGELLPAVQAGAKGPKGAEHFEALVVALHPTGVMTGGAGFGGMTLGFTPVTDDPFSGTLIIEPPR